MTPQQIIQAQTEVTRAITLAYILASLTTIQRQVTK